MADVGFNVLSPWTGAERGWKTYLAKTGSRLYKGNKKSIKLLGAQRAWWAVSGNKKGKSKRQPRGGGGDMELDALEKCTTGAPPGLCSDLGSGPPGPRSILKGKKEGFEERGARNCLRDTPFSFMLRGFRSDLPLERDLPRTPETLEEVSGNRALRNFARKVSGMIFSMVFAMFYVMFSGMSFGMFFGMFLGMIFSMFCSMLGSMFCSMFGSMFCSRFGNTFSNMFGWMVQEVVIIQCGVAASILEVAALRGSLFYLEPRRFGVFASFGTMGLSQSRRSSEFPCNQRCQVCGKNACVRRKFQHCNHYCRPCIDRWSGERWLAEHDWMGETDVRDLPGWTLLELKED